MVRVAAPRKEVISGTSHGKPNKDKNSIWCQYHDNWGSHFPSACHLKDKQSVNMNAN